MSADAARQRVASGGLTAAAAGTLAPLLTSVPIERLGEVKGLLKRYFSDAPWGAADDAALADAVGRGSGSVQAEVGPGLVVRAGWHEGRFQLEVESGSSDGVGADDAGTGDDLDIAELFATGVDVSVTPNPRTLRLGIAVRTGAATETFKRGDRVDDPAVDALFASADEIVDILVGADFVAVSIDRPTRWPAILPAVVAAVAAAWGAPDAGAEAVQPSLGGPSALAATATPGSTVDRRETRAGRAWAELGALRAGDPADLASLLAAADSDDPTRRQVAANLLSEAPPDVAGRTWATLVDDSSRSVRRTAVDAVVDAEREPLRSVLEHALRDADGWIRWKALHGLGRLGANASRDAIEPLLGDPDFRVRLEAAAVLRAR